MPSSVRFDILGGVRLRNGRGEPLPGGQQAKRVALLAYLALSHGEVRRDVLVALLWPELDRTRARQALRQTLHAVRQTVGDGVVHSTGTDVVAVDRSALACDAVALHAAAAAGDDAGVLALHAGELLLGVHVDDAPEFERWLDGERARIRHLVRACAERESERALARGDSAAAIAAARTAVAVSPFDDRAVRQAMRVLVSAGDRAAAVTLYQQFAAELRRELEAEPDASTAALVDEIRRSTVRIAMSPVATSPVATSPVGAPPIVVAPELVVTEVAIPAPAATTGIEPTPPAPHAPAHSRRQRPTRVVMLGVAALATVATIAAGAPLARSALPAPSATPDPRIVRLGVVRTSADDAGLAPVRALLLPALRDAVLAIDGVQLASTDDTSRDDTSTDDTSREGMHHGAGTDVRTMLGARGDSVDVQVEIVDRRTGTVVRAVALALARAEATDRSPRGIGGVADRVGAAVAAALYPGWGPAVSQPPSSAAYRDFAQGMRAIRREQHDTAIAAFRRAYDAHPQFATAGLLAAMELYQTKRFAASESLLRVVTSRGALAAADDELRRWLASSLRGDRFTARDAMQQVVAALPRAELAWLQLAIDNVETGRPSDALSALARIDPASEFGEPFVAYWATRAEALHLLGRHAVELAMLRDAMRRQPSMRILETYELRALAALGQVQALRARVPLLARSDPPDRMHAASLLRQIVRELRAHGHDGDAREMAGMLLAIDAQDGASDDPVGASSRVSTLYLLDVRADARAMLARLRSRGDCRDCDGALGVLAARDGDRQGALDAVARIDRAATGDHAFGRPQLWQARILSTLGDSVRAAAVLHGAFAAGLEFDVMTHTDPDLHRVRPSQVYRAFAHGEPLHGR